MPSSRQATRTAEGPEDRVASKTAMTPLTLMHVGSVTKFFTALAIATALDARALPLETPVGKVMPGLTPRAAETTFHQLLSQTSGLRDRPGESGESEELALAASARALSPSDFLLPAGVVFSYSNLGYALAGPHCTSLSAISGDYPACYSAMQNVKSVFASRCKPILVVPAASACPLAALDAWSRLPSQKAIRARDSGRSPPVK